MKGAEESYELLPPGGPSSQLHGRLDALRPAVAEEDLLLAGTGGDLGQPFRETGLYIVIVIGAREVHDLGRLLLHRLDHGRMAMPDVQNGHAAGEIQEQVAVHIPHPLVQGAVHDQRCRFGHGGQILFVQIDYAPSQRTWDVRPDQGHLPFRIVLHRPLIRLHRINGFVALMRRFGGLLRALQQVRQQGIGLYHVLLVHDEDGVGVTGNGLHHVHPLLR